MANKPFIAARIPESLNVKLEEHSKATGEGKTQVLINALYAYLGFTPETENKENASDRLSLLEAKVAELERMLKEPHQISLLDTSAVTAKKPGAKVKPDNKVDNIPSTQTTEGKKLDNHEMAALAPFSYESVRSRHKRNQSIELDGKKYLPIKEGNSCKWQLA